MADNFDNMGTITNDAINKNIDKKPHTELEEDIVNGGKNASKLDDDTKKAVEDASNDPKFTKKGKGDPDSKDKGKDGDKDKDADSEDDLGAVGTGIPFGGYTSAEIIREVVKKFVTNVEPANDQVGLLEMQYNYLFPGNNRMKIADMIKLNIPDDAATYIQQGNKGKIFNPDEAMTPNPPQYLGYTGSIASMIKDLSNAPFNEIYWTYNDPANPQVATLNYRQTPFEQEDWFNLPMTTLSNWDVISANFDVNDTQQYSLFKLTSSKSQEDTDYFAAVPPITDDNSELISRYGYKPMEVASEYFSDNESALGMSSEDLDSAKDDQNSQTNGSASSKSYPSYSAFKNYMLMDKATGKDEDNTGDIDDSKVAISNQYGGEDLYSQVKGILSDGNLSNEDKKAKIQSTSKEIATANGNTGWSIGSANAARLLSLYNSGKGLSRQAYIATALPASEAPFNIGGSGLTAGKLYGTLSDSNEIRKHPNQAAADIVNLSRGRISSGQAAALVKKINDNNGAISESEYNDILNTTPHNSTDDDVAKAMYGDTDSSGTDGNLGITYRNYQQRLFDWYADNGKFYSGEIVAFGRSDVQVGWRCYYQDDRNGSLWEFYVESISHSFAFNKGWFTTLGVTRGIKVDHVGDTKRFDMYWGKFADFQGGFFGEPNLAALVEEAKHNKEASSSGGDSSSSSGAGDDDSADGTISKGDLQSPVSGHGSFSSEQDFGGPRGSGVHDGIDFGSNSWGHTIMAVGDGEIVYAEYDASWAHGMIVLKTKGAFFGYQEYSNNWEADTKVKVGDKVKKGDVIAKMTNDHLHLGMSKTKNNLIGGSYSTDGFLNPRKYLGV